MQLSKRLMACCRYVKPGDRVADVGCDHGFLSIYLLKNKLASSIIASDIGEGPLKSAMTNADKYGVVDNIRFYISDGVQDDWYSRRCVIENRIIEYPKPQWCPLKNLEIEGKR